MRQRGRILSDVDATRWFSLVDACCRATSGHQEAVPVVVASVEVMIAALDVLDEVEDSDPSILSDLVGLPRAINASTTLLGLSHLILNDALSTGLDAEMVGRLHETLSKGIVQASIGQDADLQNDDGRSRNVDDAFHIARMKSGSLAAAACRMGALLGINDPATLSAFYEFGLHFGTMAQIANDMHDVMDGSGKTDLVAKKTTLPIAFSRHMDSDFDVDASNHDVLEPGSLHFSWVVFETERIRCRRAIEQIAELGCESKYLITLVGE